METGPTALHRGDFAPEDAAAAAGCAEVGAGGPVLGFDEVFQDREAEAVAFFAGRQCRTIGRTLRQKILTLGVRFGGRVAIFLP